MLLNERNQALASIIIMIVKERFLIVSVYDSGGCSHQPQLLKSGRFAAENLSWHWLGTYLGTYVHLIPALQ